MVNGPMAWRGNPLRRLSKPSGHPRCCCEGGSGTCGCTGITPTTLLKCTITSIDCPALDGETIDLVYFQNFTWDGTFSIGSCLSIGKVSFRCWGTTHTAADYQIRIDDPGTNPFCDLSPTGTWEVPDTASCSPFVFTLDIVIDDLSGASGYCGCCDTDPGTITLTIEEQ